MKKIVLDKIDIISITIYATFIVSCIMILGWFLGWFSSCDTLRGNLFDERVLKKLEVSWLEKPENITNEEQYIHENWCYIYECDLENQSTFERYIENVFSKFVNYNYTLGYCVDIYNYGGSLWDIDERYRIKFSNNLEDYKKLQQGNTRYEFYYTKKSVEKLKPLYDGFNMGSRWIRFELKNQPNEEQRYSFSIVMFGRTDVKDNILMPD